MPKTNDRRPATEQPSNLIGYGFDSHEFHAGVPLKIGGITLEHDKGLGGHSDGDVLLHAITDALLGAVAAPDIGALFPPSDPKWKGADSVIIAEQCFVAGFEDSVHGSNVFKELMLEVAVAALAISD